MPAGGLVWGERDLLILFTMMLRVPKRLRKLKRSFSKVTRRLDRQQFYRAVLAVVVIVLVIAVGIAAYFNFQPLNFPD
jgi:anti-sigma-K factor RskA